MSIVYTFTTLSDDIASYASDKDTEFTGKIPTFIAKAESRILKDLDLEIFEQDLGVVVSAGSRTVEKPDDSIYINEMFIRSPSNQRWKEIPKRSFSYCRMYSPVETDLGEPEFFAENEENNITVVPTPSTTYTVSNAKVLATIRPTGLSSQNESTWISNYHGDLLFEASMIEAYDYLKHPAKMTSVAQKYQSLVPSISKEIEESIRRRYKGLNSLQGADS